MERGTEGRGMEVRRGIWNDIRERQGAKERVGRRKSEEGNGIVA